MWRDASALSVAGHGLNFRYRFASWIRFVGNFSTASANIFSLVEMRTPLPGVVTMPPLIMKLAVLGPLFPPLFGKRASGIALSLREVHATRDGKNYSQLSYQLQPAFNL